MTAIANIIAKDWIAAASDSLLTVVDSKTKAAKPIEYKKSKIITIKKYRALISFFGLAKHGTWTTTDFIEKFIQSRSQDETLAEFANHLKDALQNQIAKFKVNDKAHLGLGIHLVGFENINGEQIPELFFIQNFTLIGYKGVGSFRCTTETFNHVPSEFKKEIMSHEEKRFAVKQFLDTGGMFSFNQGDPELFTPIARAIFDAFKTTEARKVLKKSDKYNIYMKLVSKPIEVLINLQKDLFNKDSKRIGGKTHRILLTSSGACYSDSGLCVEIP